MFNPKRGYFFQREKNGCEEESFQKSVSIPKGRIARYNGDGPFFVLGRSPIQVFYIARWHFGVLYGSI